MNLLELPGIRHLMNMTLPLIAVNKKIYIDPVVSPISKELIQKELREGTINKITLKPLEFVN